MLLLKTLGSLDLRSADGEEVSCVLTQPKRCALFLYLALARPRGFHRRDSLLALLWADQDERRSRNALSQSLSYLRRHFPEDMIVTRGTEEVGVAHDHLVSDIVFFEAAVAEARWADALELFRGNFLPGFHVREAPGFEEWMAQQSERLRGMAARSAWHLAWDQLGRGALPEAEHTARKALTLNGIDEREVLRFIQALADAGNRAGAVAFYERFCHHLAEELELQPSGEGQALMERVRRGDLAGAPPQDGSGVVGRITPGRYSPRAPRPGSDAYSPPPAG